jgi:hypothetical protein
MEAESNKPQSKIRQLICHKRALMVGRKTILERKKYNSKIIETGVEIVS